MTAQGVFPNVCTAVIDREARVFQHVPPLRLKTGVRYFIHSGQCNRRCEVDTLTGAYSLSHCFLSAVDSDVGQLNTGVFTYSGISLCGHV